MLANPHGKSLNCQGNATLSIVPSRHADQHDDLSYSQSVPFMTVRANTMAKL
jgi:hypothetical protein